ncbi:NIL domain-containing protein [Desulfovibrio sp. X2]|uniref:NIL domain-containing protein n=1 Tax=Desulfovibrio sp. X2 TaxID=941449 RepID=UPI000358DD0D|nr:NIL domain-containing protein [Desulfovibrio sp. X2]EPR42259.1 NIL domain-containing protein [Desulfovibrio sp. X2]
MDKTYRKIIYLAFPPGRSSQPLVCNLARNYDLTFNILKAQINPRQEGFMTLEISGSEESFRQGTDYLKEQGVRVTPVAQKISRDEDSCMHCGLCTSLCTTGALCVDKGSRRVLFDAERCSACGMCVKVCPVKAMDVDLENGILQ